MLLCSPYLVRLRPLLGYFLLGFLLLVACTAPLPASTSTPEPTPSATHTATPQPRATATPLPTATLPPIATVTAVKSVPTPTPVAGYYRHPELGFYLHYPTDWHIERTGSDLPAVIISDNDDPIQLLAGGRAIEENTELADFAHSVKDELGLAPNVELLSDGPTTLHDGTAAWEIQLGWETDAGAFQGRGYVAITGSTGYVVLLYARPEVIATRTQTVQAIAGSLTLEQAELYGVSRENALVLITEEPATLDPALTREGTASIVGHLFSGLIRFNPQLQLEPDLAERWEVSADGLTYTFYLRPDIVFHDGRSLTASDIKAAWQRAADPSLGSATAPLYLGDIQGAKAYLAGTADEISGIVVDGDTKLIVTLDAPKPYFLAKLTQPVTFVTNPSTADWHNPSGTGPFQLGRWQEGKVIVLERNPDYYLAPPSVDAVVYLLGSSGLGAYEAGLVDMTEVSPRSLSRLLDPSDPLAADLLSGPTLCTRQIMFDTTRPPFDNPDIRRAFGLAIDRQQLAEVVLNGAAIPAGSILPPLMPGYVERPFAFAPDEAQKLLGDVTALPPIVFTTMGIDSPDPLAVALADAWASNLGVTIETELIAPADYADKIKHNHGQLFTFDRCAAYPDPENILDVMYHRSGPLNVGGYANEAVDALLESARVEADPAARLALYQQAEAQILADAASIPILYPEVYLLIRPYVKGFQLTAVPLVWPALVTIERK